LLSYLQGIVDDNPKKGRYVITGSQNFTLNSAISQSLSGRIGMVTLLPLSLVEINPVNNPDVAIFYGGYPGLLAGQMHPLDFYPSYIQTYIERDVRQIKSIENFTSDREHHLRCKPTEIVDKMKKDMKTDKNK
jgi:predicted AAA+ superfamily ATPase